MIKSLTTSSLATVCGLVGAASFNVLPSFSLSNSLGIPSVLRPDGTTPGFALQSGSTAPTFPNSGTPAADSFNTNELYSATIPGGTSFSNPTYVSVAPNTVVTSATQPIAFFGPSLITVEFDYRLGGSDTRFSVFNVDEPNPLLAFNFALSTILTGSSTIVQNFTTTINTTGLGPNIRFAFGSQSPDNGVNFSNFNFTATPVPFEFNPAMGLIIGGALFGGNHLLKKAKKSKKVG